MMLLSRNGILYSFQAKIIFNFYDRRVFMFYKFDQYLALNLPGNFLKDFYVRSMRRFAECGLFRGSYIVKTKFNFSMNVDRLDAVKWFIYYFKQLEPGISTAWINLLESGDTVVDIGGNIGYHAMLASVCVGDGGKVLTFEPSSRIFADQKANLKLNNTTNVEAHQCAVSNVPGEVDLFYAGENIQGNSSIFHKNNSVSSETVKAITFDEISKLVDLSQVKLIKIDVEGAEGLVLSSLAGHVKALANECVIFVEISPENAASGHDMLKPFIDAGFHAKLIENEYATNFYRRDGQVKFSPLILSHNIIHDVVLCRDDNRFLKMAGL